jgi:hypothetical protein
VTLTCLPHKLRRASKQNRPNPIKWKICKNTKSIYGSKHVSTGKRLWNLFFSPHILNKKFKMKSREVFIYLVFLKYFELPNEMKKRYPCSMVVQGHPYHFDLISMLYSSWTSLNPIPNPIPTNFTSLHLS